MLLLPLLILMQVLPPPLGAIFAARMFGTGSQTAIILEIPRPPAATGDCDCGVPSSPRGPR